MDDSTRTLAEDAPTPQTRRSRRALREAGASAAQATSTTSADVVDVDVVVVGAGQAGLSAAYHLRRSGLVSVGQRGWESGPSFVVLDDEPGPGGAWQHRWPSLTMERAHGVHELPGMPLVVPDPAEPAARAVPYYFAQYEEAYQLHVQRPVRVTAVHDEGQAPVPSTGAGARASGRLLVHSHSVERPDERVVWRARGLVNATGTWGKPFWPAYPGRGTFGGRQLHARDFRSAADLADGHVVVVGGGTSAVQLLLEVAKVTSTTWVTRRPPTWRDEEFTPEVGREAVALVEQRTRAGLPPGSVVGVTGLPLTDAYRAGIESGVLRARPMFSRIVPGAVEWDDAAAPEDGWVDGPARVEAATILWCTGFRAALDHLAPLGLRARGGGIVMDGTQVVADPRVQLVGYGPSASTVGANRAGREAVRHLRRLLSL
ncbi:NAD(P)-binding domain-containing protein [Cellulomonas fimi]|uniref:NAD(P)-binding domain-containing protein n=1 Tax=Cellulomonas fimi TaxID=1708 RepID=UPI00235A3ECA|nr:NAD(P)-binding domain-containing protein [Cellulomonas fimi]